MARPGSGKKWVLFGLSATLVVLVAGFGIVWFYSTSTSRLLAAVERGDAEAVRREIARGADVNFAWDEEWENNYPGGAGKWVNLTPLYVAAGEGYSDVVDELIAAGADIEAAEGGTGWRPLYWAAMNNHAGAAQSLIDAGAEVDAVAQGNVTALLQSARKSPAIVRLLLDAGADPTMTDVNGKNALFWAGSAESAQLILDTGVDVNARDHKQTTPLISNSYGDRAIDLVELLIEHGADLDAMEATGKTALGEAVMSGGTEVVASLLEHGANPNARDFQDRTPLMHVFVYGDNQVETVRLLIEAGADPDLRDKDGKTALDILGPLLGDDPEIVEQIEAILESGR